jgi:hypothetical protein
MPARRIPGVGLYRLDASVGFANHERVEARLVQALDKLEPGQTLILDMVAVYNIDNAGLTMLTMLSVFAKQCKLRKVRLFFSGWKARVRFTLHSAHDRWLRAHNKHPTKSKRAGANTTQAAASSLEAQAPDTPPPQNESLAPYAFHTVARGRAHQRRARRARPQRLVPLHARRRAAHRAGTAGGRARARAPHRGRRRACRAARRDWIFVDQARTVPPAHDMAMPATTHADDTKPGTG